MANSKSYVVAVLVDGCPAVEVDESSRPVALQIARLASDPKSYIAVRGLKGATRVMDSDCTVVARFIGGERLS